MLRLKTRYEKEVVPRLMKKFKYRNPMQVPRLEKVVLNAGVGDAIQNSKSLDNAASEMAIISGQRAVITKAKQSIAAFKLRAGMSIGCKVTLRGTRMFTFLDKLFNLALPRIRDFRGLSPKSFDGRGNYSLGVKEQLLFPEIEYDKVEKIRGMDICIVTSARSDEEAKFFLMEMGLPVREG
ncbi:MAG: 50S ribosomal protein L5 [Armatimonadetes bacterium]|nr:50S ribosomal protein L5 [Armatimonadota bacterium]